MSLDILPSCCSIRSFIKMSMMVPAFLFLSCANQTKKIVIKKDLKNVEKNKNTSSSFKAKPPKPIKINNDKIQEATLNEKKDVLESVVFYEKSESIQSKYGVFGEIVIDQTLNQKFAEKEFSLRSKGSEKSIYLSCKKIPKETITIEIKASLFNEKPKSPEIVQFGHAFYQDECEGDSFLPLETSYISDSDSFFISIPSELWTFENNNCFLKIVIGTELESDMNK